MSLELPIHDPAQDRRRRHGRDLPGQAARRAGFREDRRAQAHLHDVLRRPAVPPHAGRRGARRDDAQPQQHRPGARPRRGRRALLPGARAGRRLDARPRAPAVEGGRRAGRRPRSRSTSPPRSAARSPTRTARSAATASRSGIVHRDISPHNVLLSEQGEVKLTDFGIAKAQTRKEQSLGNLIKGKIAFMSPEQAAGERARRALGPVLGRHDALRDDHAPPPVRRADRLRDADAGEERRLPAARDRAARPQPRALSRDSQGDGEGRRATATRRPRRCWSTSSR